MGVHYEGVSEYGFVYRSLSVCSHSEVSKSGISLPEYDSEWSLVQLRGLSECGSVAYPSLLYIVSLVIMRNWVCDNWVYQFPIHESEGSLGNVVPKRFGLVLWVLRLR